MQAGSSAPAGGMSTVGRSFERLAAVCAVTAGVGGFLYSIAFVADAASDSSVADLSSSLLLLIAGLLTLVAPIGVHEHVRRVDASFALLAVVLAAIANTGAIVHATWRTLCMSLQIRSICRMPSIRWADDLWSLCARNRALLVAHGVE